MSYSHVQRVKILYKSILRLHRGLPPDLAELGTKYVKDEFKRHKRCKTEEIPVFMNEWTNYAISLTQQLGVRGPHTQEPLGTHLSEEDLNKFRDEQIYQLHELLEASRKDDTAR